MCPPESSGEAHRLTQILRLNAYPIIRHKSGGKWIEVVALVLTGCLKATPCCEKATTVATLAIAAAIPPGLLNA
jgi:hypothetical protein